MSEIIITDQMRDNIRRMVELKQDGSPCHANQLCFKESCGYIQFCVLYLNEYDGGLGDQSRYGEQIVATAKNVFKRTEERRAGKNTCTVVGMNELLLELGKLASTEDAS